MSSITPFTQGSNSLLGAFFDGVVTGKAAREVAHAHEQLAAQDAVIRDRNALAARRAEDEAFSRNVYVANRMHEAKLLAYTVVNEPDERVRSTMANWVDIHQENERRIYLRTFGS